MIQIMKTETHYLSAFSALAITCISIYIDGSKVVTRVLNVVKRTYESYGLCFHIQYSIVSQSNIRNSERERENNNSYNQFEFSLRVSLFLKTNLGRIVMKQMVKLASNSIKVSNYQQQLVSYYVQLQQSSECPKEFSPTPCTFLSPSAFEILCLGVGTKSSSLQSC